jgi:pimeloyl-ACP methyl ester carboxylesterase
MRVATALGNLFVEDSQELGLSVTSKPTILLWHSFLHHGGMWREQLPMLRDRFRVLNIDAPGHGRSEPVRRDFTMKDCAKAAVDVLDATGTKTAIFCGLSWGGMTAMATALAAPSRLTAMIVMDTSARAEPRRNKIEYALLAKVFTTLGSTPFLAARTEQKFFAAAARAHRRDVIADFQSHVARIDRPSVVHALECIADREPLIDQLSSVRIPTLVVVGAEDVAQPVTESEAIAGAIPGADLVVVPRAGHLSVIEQPAMINARLERFFDDLDRAPVRRSAAA